MDHEEMKSSLILRLASHGAALAGPERAAKLATQFVEDFERSAQAAWTPATGGMPDTPKLIPGDNLLVVDFKTRYREQEIHEATVTHMARFKVRMTWERDGRTIGEDFDIRTRGIWTTGSDRMMGRSGGRSFFTADQWAWEQRARLADEYLKERGIYPGSVRGPLSPLLHEDRLGFANALRRLEGLVEL